MNLRAMPWLLVLLPLLAACGSPIVGAECASGLTLCDGRCVDLESDPANCGSCGDDCGAFECSARMCGPNLRPDAGGDAGPGDGGMPEDGGLPSIDSGRPPPTTGRGGTGNPYVPDGGFDFPDDAVVNGCSLGDTDCGGVCADLQSDPEHCGGCGHACGPEQYCAAGVCVDVCEDPLRPCPGACVDFENDERNCGGCGIVCRSGLCKDGNCADVVPGHLVVIGHDYARPPVPNMQRIASNAVFLSPRDEVRTLVYRGAAQEASVLGVNAAVDEYMKSKSWSQTEVDPDRLSAQLAEADTLLLHAQAGATDAELIELGQRWGLSMTQFLLRGGVIVLFETYSTKNAGGYQLLSPAGLFVAGGRAQVPAGEMLALAEPGDSVARDSLAMYLSRTNTVRFVGVQSAGTTVVEDPNGEPVVIHRVIVP